MTVIIAENTPDKVRGLLKRWFVEPKPNVFVGSVNRKTRDKVLQYLLKYSPDDLALLVICDEANSQGFRVYHYRDPKCHEVCVSGHYLLCQSQEAENVVVNDVEDISQNAKIKVVLEECMVRYDCHT